MEQFKNELFLIGDTEWDSRRQDSILILLKTCVLSHKSNIYVRCMTNIKVNKEENRNHVIFHPCKFLPINFMLLVEFLRWIWKHRHDCSCDLIYESRICLDIVKSHTHKLCMNLIPCIFPSLSKEIWVFPIRTKNKITCLQRQPSKHHCVCDMEKGENKVDNFSEEMLLIW